MSSATKLRDEAVALMRDARLRRGLPPKVDDEATLSRVAALVLSVLTRERERPLADR